jgi:hypothetical protein
VSGDSSTSESEGSDTPSGAGIGFTGSGFGQFRDGVGTLRASGGDLHGGSETLVAQPLKAYHGRNNADETLITHALTAEYDASEDGTGRGVPLIAQTLTAGVSSPGVSAPGRRQEDDANLVPYVKIVRSGARDEEGNLPAEQWAERETAPTLNAMDNTSEGRSTVLFALRGREGGAMPEVTDVANSLRSADGGSSRDYVFAHVNGMDIQPSEDVAPTLRAGHDTMPSVAQTIRSHPRPGSNDLGGTVGTAVRRLTPTECERLQGFPDGWTADQKDSARYKQMGNAVCVNVVEWIIKRLVKVDGAS